MSTMWNRPGFASVSLIAATALLALSGVTLTTIRAIGIVDWSWWVVTAPFVPVVVLLGLLGLGMYMVYRSLDIESGQYTV